MERKGNINGYGNGNDTEMRENCKEISKPRQNSLMVLLFDLVLYI